jgi:L-arabinonolactonase
VCRLVTEPKVETAAELGLLLGEGPVWDERRQELFVVDLTGNAVHGIKPSSTGATRGFEVDRSVGCVVLCQDGRLLLAAQDRFLLAGPDGSGMEVFGPFRVKDPEHRFNDGKVDPHGRLVVGTMAWSGEPPQGELLMLKPDGSKAGG